LELVPAQRVHVLELEVGLLERRLRRAPVPRSLVVLEDLLAIEVVHQSPNTSRTLLSASTRRSTSSVVECSEKLARDVAVTPSRRMSGCAQWWPARMQTPWRPRISATSCGWTPATLNEQIGPRSGGP